MKENYQKQLDALLASLAPEGKPRLLPRNPKFREIIRSYQKE